MVTTTVGGMGVTAYLDESGTHAGSARVMIGAIATMNGSEMDRIVEERVADLLADDDLWISPVGKREDFRRRGFHHSEDDDTVRGRFQETLGQIEFRAHVCHSRRAIELSDEELLIVMYYTVVRNLLRRYAGQELELVFEENPSLNSLYGQLTAHAVENLDEMNQARAEVAARIGTKPSAGLSVVDYVLAFTGHYLDDQDANALAGRRPKTFQLARFETLKRDMAHLVDFDLAAHQGRLAMIL